MIIYVVFVLAVALAAWLSVSLTQRGARVVVVAVFGLLCLIAPDVYFSLLSWPKALIDEVRRDPQVEVLAYHADPGTALYLVLAAPAPRFFFMPWSQEAQKIAQQLQDGNEGPAGTRPRMFLKHPFENSLNQSREAYPEPQPAPTPKQPAPPVARFFSR